MNAPAALPFVSVVVPARDAEATAGDCVRSLLALDYPDDRIELIVVDNRSTDGTRAALDEFGDRVQVLDEARRGAAAARNRGIAAARGEIIAFTDADCVVDRGWLRTLVVALADPSVCVAGGRILARRPCNSVALFGEEIHDHARAMNDRPPYAITMSWASRTATLRAAGGFDETLIRGQDTDLAYRLVQSGQRLCHVPDSIVFHRNRTTLASLMQEGFLHGRASRAVGRIHAKYLARFDPRPPPLKRLRADLFRMKDVRRIRSAFYRLVFDLGKVCGEWAGEIR